MPPFAKGGEQAIRLGAGVGLEIEIDVVSHGQLAHRFGGIVAHDDMAAEDRQRDVHYQLGLLGRNGQLARASADRRRSA